MEAWDHNDWGIFLADKLAGGDLRGFERLACTTPVVVGDSDVLDAIGVVPDVIIAGENGPSLSDPRQLEVSLVEMKYKVRRDRYRAEARVPRPPQVGTSRQSVGCEDVEPLAGERDAGVCREDTLGQARDGI